MSTEGWYSEVADAQLDELEGGPDADLYHDVLDLCEQIFDNPGQIRVRSSAIRTGEGIRFVTPLRGHPPYKVFWSRGEDGRPRIEAVFPRP